MAAALVFLDLNGIRITASDEDLETLTIGVAVGRIAKASAAELSTIRIYLHQ